MKEWRRDADIDDPAETDDAIAPGKRSMTERLWARADQSQGVAPGKQTLTSRLFATRPVAAAIQRRAAPSSGEAASEEPAAVQAQAAAGVSGAGAELPFRDLIEQAFGFDHDLSGIRAHIGGPAAVAAEAIGATAYATGNDVAFASAPDLYTAAHEAAHVIQQRAGVHLHGGVGQDGDVYERHADEVADRVVAGQSAADLLAAGPARGASTAVQRRRARGGGDAAASAGPDGDLMKAVDRVETAATALQLALYHHGPIDAPTGAFERALDRLAAAVHQQQAPSRVEAAAVRRVLTRADEVIRAVGARHHSAHPTLDRLAVSLRAHVDRVAKSANESTREVNAARLRVHVEFTVEQLASASAALKNAGAGQTAALVEARRQASAWAEALIDPDAPAGQATAASAGRAIEQQFETVRLLAPRVAEVAAAPPSYSTGAALTALEAALGASSLPVARLAPARARAEAAYQQWKLDQAKSALDAVADSEGSLASLGRRPTGASQSLGRRWQDLEAEANRGQLDLGALDDLTVEAEELAVYRNAQVVIAQCQQLEQILGELDGDEEVRIELRGAAHFTQSQLEKFGKRRRDDVSHRRAAIEALRRDLGAWFGGRDFIDLLGGLDADGRDHEGRAVAKIRSAQTRQTIKAIVKTIAITLASMGIAAVASGLARTAYLRWGSAANTAATADRVALGVGFAADVVFNTTMQKVAMHDPRSVLTLGLINAAMPLVAGVVAKSISRVSGIAANEVRFFEHFHVTTTHITVDAVAGAMVDHAISKARGEPSATPETAADWLVAGACIGFARGLATNAAALRALEAIHNKAFDLAYKKLGPLLPEADALIARINTAAGPEELAAIQGLYERFVAEEIKFLDAEVAHSDPKRAHAGRTMAREQNRRSKRVDDAADAKARDLAAEAKARDLAAEATAKKPSGDASQDGGATDDATGATQRADDEQGANQSSPKPASQVTPDANVAPPRLAVAKAMQRAGMTRAAVERLFEILNKYKKLGLRLTFRPTNPKTAALLAEGALPKPETIKANTVNKEDLYLGMPAEHEAKVAHWDGWRLPKDIDAIEARDPALAKGIRDRYASRLKDFKEQAQDMERMRAKGTIAIKDGIVYEGQSGQVYTGDYDLYSIDGVDGHIPEGSPLYDEIAEELRAPPISIQHGPLVDWPAEKPADVARKAALIARHKERQDLVTFGPDDGLQVGGQ